MCSQDIADAPSLLQLAYDTAQMHTDTPMEAEGPGVAAAAPAQAAQAPEGAGGAAAEAQTDAHAGGEPQPQAVSGGGKHGLGAWPPPRMGAPAGCHTLIGGMSLPSAVPQLSRRMPAAHLCRRCRRRLRLQAPEAAADGQPPPQGQQQQHAFNPNKKRKVALFMAYVGHGYQVWLVESCCLPPPLLPLYPLGVQPPTCLPVLAALVVLR